MARLDSYDLAMATIKIILLNRFTKPLLDNSRSKVLLKSIGIAYKLYFEGIFRLGQLICELYFLFI